MPDSKPTMIDFLHAADTVQRECAACGGGDKLCPECAEELRRQPNEEDEELQAKATPGQMASLSPALERNINSLRGGGQPLSASERAFFEPRFKTNFSTVRVHTGSGAGELAQSLDAQAFTIGSDIVFGQGEYSPGSSTGLHLLAHELAHVVQQGATGKVGVRIQRQNPASGGQAGFRLAPVAYDKVGQPLSDALTQDEVAKLQALKDAVQSGNPTLYSRVENENILLSRATLFTEEKDVPIQPEGAGPSAVIPVSGQEKSVFVESGKLFANFKKEPKERYEAEWWAFDRAGGDCLKGIYPTAAEEEKAWEQLESSVSPADFKKMNSTRETRNCQDKSEASVVVLDLDRIAKQKEDPVQVLQHELGHFIYLQNVKLVDATNPGFPVFAPVSAAVAKALKAMGYDQIISDEADLLTEIAARQMENKQQFDEASFMEEFDPLFGIDGYRQIDGSRSSPTGFGIRVAKDLTLLDAKNKYQDFRAGRQEAPFPADRGIYRQMAADLRGSYRRVPGQEGGKDSGIATRTKSSRFGN